MEEKSKQGKNDCKESLKQKKSNLQIGILSVLVLFLSTGVIVMAVFLSKEKMQVCDKGHQVKPRNFEKPRVFEPLTPMEIKETYDYLMSRTNLNLVPLTQGTPTKAYIYSIELLLPTKANVLQHLNSKTEQPKRCAKVIVMRGDLSPRVVEEYEVGPLPKPSYKKKINKKQIPYLFKPMDVTEYSRIFEILTDLSKALYPIITESYGLAYHNCTPNVNCLTFYDVAPRGINDNERKSWFWALRDVEGFYLHPLGLEIQIDHSAKTFSEWRILQIVYNGQSRSTVKELLDDYKSGKINKIKMPNHLPKDNLYSSYKRRGKMDMKTPLRGPKLIEPDGHRYQINGLHVTYMNWDFDLFTKFTTGLQLFDIRFQDQRIVYELSLQEACVFYSGYGPAQGITNYYDTSWLMGAFINELVPGVDCPGTSSFIDVDYFANGDKAQRIRNGICIFEDHAEHPLRRHYASDFHGSYFYYGGLGDYRLVVRTISNVWNYDYIFDYIFHLSGAVEVRVSSTGYVQSSFPLLEERRYGSQLKRYMMANIHQHLFHYKVDLDINGPSNVYATLDISTETIKAAWYPDYNKTQFKYEANPKKNEFEANFKNKVESRYDIFYNDKIENDFGHKKAYRILNLGKTPFLLSESSETNAGRWAKYPLAVSKHKDSEETSTSVYANQGPRNPIVDFEQYIMDNDTLLNEDLVAWVTIGMLHIPHTEDVPSTTTAGSQYRFYLLPFNYFQECPSMSSADGIHIVPDDEEGNIIDDNGMKAAPECIQEDLGPKSFNGRIMPVT